MLSLKAHNHRISHIGDKHQKSAEDDKTTLPFTADNLGDRRRAPYSTARHDPMLSAVSGRFEETKIAGSQKNTQSGDIQEGWATEE